MTSRTSAAIEPIAMPTIDPVDICAVLGGFVALAGVDWLDAELDKLVIKLEEVAKEEGWVVAVVMEAVSKIVVPEDAVDCAVA